MKKLGILLGIFIVIGSVTEADAQCWIDKSDGLGFRTVGKIRPNSSSDDCSSHEIAAVAAYLLLFEETGN